MKKISSPTQLIALTFLALLLAVSCKKEKSGQTSLTPQEEEAAVTASSESSIEQELVFNDVFDNVLGVNSEVGLGGTGVFGRSVNGREYGVDSARCFTVTVTRLSATEPFPVSILIDFGSGCTGKDGHTRSGKIHTEYSGRLTVPGKSATTTFDGYKIDSLSIQGVHKLTNTTSGGKRQFTIDITEAKLTQPNGNYAQWSGHRELTQTEGNLTPDIALDDQFTLTGYASGKVKKGDHLYAWKSEITEPLLRKFTCRWISSGILEVRRETLPAGSPWAGRLNYGAGTCDNKATLTINGATREIILH
jgi:hypothetical protein